MSEQRTSDPALVPIRPAATVMIVRNAVADPDRDGEADSTVGPDSTVAPGVEVFMLRRTLAAVFGSGMYVFPGGRVETTDGADHDAAHRLAAIRECFEEAGVLLAAHAVTGDSVVDGHPALDARAGVYDGSVDIVELCTAHDLVPATEQLVWVSHWITPIGEQRRFDTRFYLVPAPAGQTSVHDDNETIASLWARPADALARHAAGELTMMPPTVKNLQFLSQFADVAEAMAVAATLPPPECILPKIRFVDGAITGVVLPGEAGYDEM